MAAQPVLSAEEWSEGMRHARPSPADDVTVLWDGRRLDSRATVMEWLAEVAIKRAKELGAGADARAWRPPSDLRRLIEVLGRQDTLSLARFVSAQPRYNLLFRQAERELFPLA